jgi:hypothetical protein
VIINLGRNIVSFDTKYLGELTQLMKIKGSKFLPLTDETLHKPLDSDKILFLK